MDDADSKRSSELGPARVLRQQLQALEARAQEGLQSERPAYSRRRAAAECRKLGVRLDAQRISDWLNDGTGTRPRTWEPVWALVQVWTLWAGDPALTEDNKNYWTKLCEDARVDSSSVRNPTPQRPWTVSEDQQPPPVPPEGHDQTQPSAINPPGWILRRAATRVLVAMAVAAPVLAIALAGNPFTSDDSSSADHGLSGERPAQFNSEARKVLTERFDMGNSESWPKIWKNVYRPSGGFGAGATVKNGIGVMATSDEANNWNRISQALDVIPQKNVSILLSFRLDDPFVCFPSVFVRGNEALDTGAGYALTFEVNHYYIDRFLGYGDTKTLDSFPYNFNLGAWYSDRFEVIGNTMRARVWPQGRREPVGWLVTAHDSYLPDAGTTGLTLIGSTQSRPCSWYTDEISVSYGIS